MRSIGTRFSIAVGVFAVLFSVILVYRTWLTTQAHLEQLTAVQAKLALEFDLAIREYAAESIRPEMASRIGPDEFVVAAMSTSFIARNIFEKVRLDTVQRHHRPGVQPRFLKSGHSRIHVCDVHSQNHGR